MTRGYKSALCTAILPILLFTGCSSAPLSPYGEIYRAPIPSGYEKKDDMINVIKPEIREKAKEAYDGMNIRSDHIIPHSKTKVSAKGLKVNIPWEKLEDILPID